jgi:hypothetical protein
MKCWGSNGEWQLGGGGPAEDNSYGKNRLVPGGDILTEKIDSTDKRIPLSGVINGNLSLKLERQRV